MGQRYAGEHGVVFKEKQWQRIQQVSGTTEKSTHQWVRELVMDEVFAIATNERSRDVGTHKPALDVEKVRKHINDVRAALDLAEETLDEATELNLEDL